MSKDINSDPHNENVYETGFVTYGNGQVAVGVPAQEPAVVVSKPQGVRSMNKFKIAKWVMISLIATVTLGLLIFLVVDLTRKNKISNPNDSITEEINAENANATSCRELNAQGITTDGIYIIQPDEKHGKVKAYCDMTTDGGGWTLVATIHESEIKRKCGEDDLWSEYLPRDQVDFAGKDNWENQQSFGNVFDSNIQDYKSPAYSSIQASDLMIWHVPSAIPIIAQKSHATLRYRTTNHVLQKYGGNLHSIYKNHYPLDVVTELGQSTTEQVLEALVQSSSSIKAWIPDWHEYTYSATPSYQISGDEMYRYYGNLVHMYGSSYITYGDTYRISGTDSFFGAEKSHPFFAVGVIHNEKRQQNYFSITVTSYRPPGDNQTMLSDVITDGNYKLQYHVIQFSHSNYPTVCELHFLVSNVEDWNSVEPTAYQRGSYSFFSTYRRTEFRAQGYPANIVMGYTLLSRTEGRYVTEEQAAKVSKEILRTISSISTLFKRFDNNDTLSVPVVFDKGTPEDVLSMIPSYFRPYVQPGYLQFRAYNLIGYPNAFCPGVRTKSYSPEYICIGGKSNDIDAYGTCGDFAGWEGKSGDVVQANQPVGFAHSHKDIFTTIMMFYR